MNQSFCRIGISLIAICCVAVIGTQLTESCHGQESTQSHAEALPAAETILDRHIEATGGMKAQMAVKSKTLSGTFGNDLGGHTFEADLTVTSVAPNKQHFALHHAQFNMVRVTNGVKAWEWRAGGNHRHSDDSTHQDPGQTSWLEAPEMKKTIEKAMFNAHFHWRKRFKTVKTVGIVDVNKKPAYEVQVTNNDGEQFSQFYDKSNGRHVRTTRTVESSSLGKYKIDSRMERYQEFDGVWLVTKSTTTLHTDDLGEGSQSYEFTNVKLNGDVPASLFKVPSELKDTKTSQK